MTSVSKELRAALAERFTLDRPEVVAEQVSVDGTRKWLLRLPGDADSGLPHDVECVYIPDTDRGTLCVSSQVGCTLNCSFCHTGTQRLVRNLTAGEIVGQVMVARDRLGDWPGGTRPTDGDRPDRRAALHHQHRDDGHGRAALQSRRRARRAADRRRRRGHRHFQAPHHALDLRRGAGDRARRRARSAACWRCRCTRCATSCATSWCRSTANIQSPQLLEACRNYPGVSNAKRITFEYVMLKGVNDSIDDAKALVRLLKGIPAKINLIPFNPWPGSKYECSDWEQIEKFSAGRVRRRLRLAGAHAARPRHSRRLRPAQERDRETLRARAHGAARHGDDGLAHVASSAASSSSSSPSASRSSSPASRSPSASSRRNGRGSIPIRSSA